MSTTPPARRLCPYPAYRDSAAPWFGEVPTHWDVVRLGAVLRERGEVNNGPKTENILSVLRDVGVINYDDKGDIGNKKSEDIERYRIVHIGDLVINSMNVIIGSVGLSSEYGALSPVYIVLRAVDDTVLMRYYGYVFRIKLFQQSLSRIGNGILSHRLRIPISRLRMELLPKPPLPEQRAIVAYLDRKLAQIDQYIANKRRLIDLLREQKQAIINHAVTRGLDPDAPRKPSGVEWLGEVPEHWEITSLKYVARFKYGDSLPSEKREDGEIPVYGSNGIVGYHSIANTNSPCLIVGRKGSYGKVQYSSISCFAIDTTFFIDQISCRADMKWFYLLLPLIGLDDASQDAVVPGLSREFAHQQKIPVPPLPEQRAIAAYLDRKLAQINLAITQAEREVELMQEYRTTLISDVVTGKVDVREHAAELAPGEPL